MRITEQTRLDQSRQWEGRTGDGGSKPAPRGARAGKDAGQMLRAGFWFLLAGAISIILIITVFGGIHQHGPQTNGGWMLLVLALMCVPLGLLLVALGGAKWLGRRP